MREIKFTIVFFISLIFLYSCAKPTVVSVVMPEDEKLNCEELKEAIDETLKMKQEAEHAKENTGGNVARVMLFWPAWAQTLHNADVAIKAANDRNLHLIKIMKKKRCSNIESIKAEITGTSLYKNSIAGQLKDLHEMYKSGILTKEEYEMAKKKTLSQ